MPTDVPDTLGNLPRDPSFAGSSSSAASAAAAQTSQAQDQHDSGEASILEDMEVAAAAGQASSSRHSKRKTPATERQEEDAWMVDLRSTMRANQALLERLLEEKSQPPSSREVFIRYVSDSLRSATEEEFRVMHDEIAATLMRRGHTGPSTSGAGPVPSTAPQASTTSHVTPPTYSQQHYVQLTGFPSPSNWQYLGGQHPSSPRPASHSRHLSGVGTRPNQ